MLVGEVFGDGVVAPSTATQRIGNSQTILDGTATGGGADSVHNDTAYGQGFTCHDDVALVVGVNSGSMAVAFHLQVGFQHVDAFFEAVVADATHNRAHLFLADAVCLASAYGFGNDNAGSFRNADAGTFGNDSRRLAYSVTVDNALFIEHEVQQFFLVGFVHEVSAVLLEGGENSFLVLFGISEELFAGADDTVIESTAGDDHVGSLVEVNVGIDDDLNVAGTYAERRLSGRVGGLNHAHTAGSDNDIHGLHQFLGLFDGRFFHNLYQVIGHAHRLELFLDQVNCGRGADFRFRVRSDNDGVLGFEGEHDFAHRRNHGVRHRSDTADNAHRLGNRDHVGTFVDFEDPHRLLATQVVPYTLRFVAAFGHFVFVNAHLGFFNGHLGQFFGVVEYYASRSFDYSINRVLVEGSLKNGLGFPCLSHHFLDFHCIYVFYIFFSSWAAGAKPAKKEPRFRPAGSRKRGQR